MLEPTRQRGPNACPRAGTGLDLERSPGPLGARAHPLDPEVPGRDGVRVEPDAVVLDGQVATPSASATLDPRVGRIGVLDDVVERLLADPVEDVLACRAASRSGSSAQSTTIDRPVRPSTAAACVRRAWTSPSRSRLPGRSSKISAAHLGQRVPLELAQLPSRSAAAAGSRSSSSSMLRVMRVMLNSAWVTESWSSRARWARSSLAAISADLAAELAFETVAGADVAGRAVGPDEPAVDHDPDRA